MDQAYDLSEEQIVAVGRISQHLNDKYSCAPDTFANLDAFRREAEELFDAIEVAVEVNTVLVGRPQIEVIGSKVPIDPEKEAFDIRRGLADSYWERARQRMEARREQYGG